MRRIQITFTYLHFLYKEKATLPYATLWKNTREGERMKAKIPNGIPFTNYLPK